MKYSGHRKLLCEFTKLSKFKIKCFYPPRILDEFTDASILVYKFRLARTGFKMYAEYTQPQLTFLALLPRVRVKKTFNNIQQTSENKF